MLWCVERGRGSGGHPATTIWGGTYSIFPCSVLPCGGGKGAGLEGSGAHGRGEDAAEHGCCWVGWWWWRWLCVGWGGVSCG